MKRRKVYLTMILSENNFKMPKGLGFAFAKGYLLNEPPKRFSFRAQIKCGRVAGVMARMCHFSWHRNRRARKCP